MPKSASKNSKRNNKKPNRKTETITINLNTLLDPSVLFSLLLLVLISIFLLAYKPNNNSSTQANSQGQAVGEQNTSDNTANLYDNLPITDQDRIYGNKNARISVVEFVDLECPFCRRIYDYPDKLMTDFGDKINWVFKNFPLSIHEPYATREAMFVECIADIYDIEAYKKLHDKIFEGNGKYTEEQLAQMVADLGYDKERVLQCVKSEKFKEKIQNDFKLGQNLGVQGTPTLIILDHKTKKTVVIPGAVAYENVKSQIEAMLEE